MAATAAAIESRSVTSIARPTPSSSPATVFAPCSSMSPTATRAPSAASRRAVAAPMPDAPPVTSAILPSSLISAKRSRSPRPRVPRHPARRQWTVRATAPAIDPRKPLSGDRYSTAMPTAPRNAFAGRDRRPRRRHRRREARARDAGRGRARAVGGRGQPGRRHRDPRRVRLPRSRPDLLLAGRPDRRARVGPGGRHVQRDGRPARARGRCLVQPRRPRPRVVRRARAAARRGQLPHRGAGAAERGDRRARARAARQRRSGAHVGAFDRRAGAPFRTS